MQCVEFFAQYRGQPQWVHEASKHASELARWESESAMPSVSPCPVAASETVARRIFHPTHIDSYGVLVPAVFDDMFNKGLSVDRVAYSDAVLLAAESHLIATSRGREYFGSAMIRVDTLRALITRTGLRIAYVFDTAIPEDLAAGVPANQAHADVCCIISNKLERRAARLKVFEAFKPGIEVIGASAPITN